MPYATEYTQIEPVHRCKTCHTPLPLWRRCPEHRDDPPPGPTPPGWRRCGGDPACPILLHPNLVRQGVLLCPSHDQMAAIQLQLWPGRRSQERNYDDLVDLMEGNR